MPREPLRQFLQHLRRVVGVSDARALDDTELLERFVSRRDGAAFEVLVWRHGGLVLDVCARLLHHPHDIEDAFQATFLVLVRQAKGIRKRAALASWLYKVAYNVALRVRRGNSRMCLPLSMTATLPAPDTNGREHWSELRPVLDDEINRLPDKYRSAVVLCYLQGLTTADAARRLGCAQGTIHSRLAWARARLRSRLVRRGVTISVPGLAATLSCQSAAAVPASLVAATIRLGLAAATGKAATAAGVFPVAVLAEGVMRTMFFAKVRAVAAASFVICALGLGAGVIGPSALADKPFAPPTLVPGKPDTIQLPAEVLARLGIQTAEVKARGDLVGAPLLRLSGVLTYDPDRMVSVRSRIAGEIVEVAQASSMQFFPLSMALIVRAPSRTHGTSGGSSGSGSTSTSGTTGSSSGSSTSSVSRQLRFGDGVSKGQVLAVVYSKELGMKQVEFLNAVAHERLDRDELERLQQLFKKGAIAEAAFRAAEREAKIGANKLLAAKRTLLLWKLTPEEIDSLTQALGKKGSPDAEKRLGQIVIRAPIDGVVVESNIAIGNIVDPGAVLFRIADLSRLQVVTNASERDLAALRALPAAGRRWTIRAAGAPAVEGQITHIPLAGRPENKGALDRHAEYLRRLSEAYYHRRGIGKDRQPGKVDSGKGMGALFFDYDNDGAVDLFVGPAGSTRFLDLDNDGWFDLYVAGSQGAGPLYRNLGDGRFEDITQATGLGDAPTPIIGWADNSAGRLHAGQFVTATVQLPANRQEAAVPTSALVLEAGKEYVIVQPVSGKLEYTPRRVLVVRRDRHVAHIRVQLTAAEISQGFQGIRPGERIITRGAVDVKGMIEELR